MTYSDISIMLGKYVISLIRWTGKGFSVIKITLLVTYIHQSKMD